MQAQVQKKGGLVCQAQSVCQAAEEPEALLVIRYWLQQGCKIFVSRKAGHDWSKVVLLHPGHGFIEQPAQFAWVQIRQAGG